MLEIYVYKHLPDEVLDLIFSFGNQMKYRRGKFMSQILPTDPRKNLLKRVPRPIYIPPLFEDLNEEQEEEETVNFHNDKKNRAYVSLKNGKKEMIHHYFCKENNYYYDYIYLSKGRMIGYVHKKLYRIDICNDSNGKMYNEYTIIDVD